MPSLNEMKNYFKSRPKAPVGEMISKNIWLRRHSANINTNQNPPPLSFNTPTSSPKSNNNTRHAFAPIKSRPFGKTRKGRKGSRKATRKHRR